MSASDEEPDRDLVRELYGRWDDRGPVAGGRRLTVLSPSTRVAPGEPVSVFHVAEVTERGRTLYIAGPKAVVGEYVDGELATPIPLEIDDFDATGTYEVRSEIVSSRSDVASCPAVGAVREYSIELFDVRPELTLRIGLGAPELRGSVDSAGGIHGAAFGFRNCSPFVCGFDPAYSVSGQVDRRESDARYAIDAMIFRRDPCSLIEHVTGERRPS